MARYGVVDLPNQRSSHKEATLRGGGVAILVTVFCGAIIIALLVPQAAIPIGVVALGTLAAGILGLIEDVRGLAVPVRALLQLVIGFAVAIPLVVATGHTWLLAVVAGLALMAYINISNFMDGINGISGLHGLVAGAVYGAVGAAMGLEWAAALGALIGGAFAAFLPWNVSRPGLFLGDVGSYTLGAGIAGLGIALVAFGAPILLVVAPVSIYLSDTGATLARRAIRSEPVLRAHRTHAYQRLTDTGMSHVAAAMTVTLFTLATSVIACLPQVTALPGWIALLGVVVVCAAYLALPRVRGSRLEPVATLALGAFDAPDVVPAHGSFLPQRWAVIGASGFVGHAVESRLRAGGHEVVRVVAPRLALSQSVSSPEAIMEMAAEDASIDTLVSQLAGVDVVINAAGMASPDSGGSEALYGANTLLPAVIRSAAARAGALRVIHISSAAVQGRRLVLDESADASPFSPYSRSKALGERAFLAGSDGLQAIVIRATSVQGAGRRTTRKFQKIASSALASVANDGSQPTVVSSIDGLSDFVYHVSIASDGLRPIMLQPWEGCTAREVLRAAGGKEPVTIPRWSSQLLLAAARALGRIVPEVAGAGRRLELMWLGQAQVPNAGDYSPLPKTRLLAILKSSPEESA